MFYKEYTDNLNWRYFMSRCRICGKYSDPYEWPEEFLPNFRQDMCFDCYQQALNAGEFDQDDDDSDDEQDSEPEIDPEIDDTPILEDDDSDQPQDKEEEETLDATTDPGNEPDESANIRNLRKMLFG